MQDQHPYWFASRSVDKEAASRRVRLLAVAGLVFAFCAGLQGCASDQSWPTLSKITDLGNIMSPEERQKAVQELQKDGQKPSDTGQPTKDPQ